MAVFQADDTPYNIDSSLDDLFSQYQNALDSNPQKNAYGMAFESGGEGIPIEEFNTSFGDGGRLLKHFDYTGSDQMVPGMDNFWDSPQSDMWLHDKGTNLYQTLKQNDQGQWINSGDPWERYPASEAFGDLASVFSTVSPMLGGVGNIASGMGITNPIASQAINSGFKSGLGNLFVSGGDLGAFGQGFTGGAMSGGIGAGFDAWNPGQLFGSDEGLGKLFNRSLSGGFQSLAQGGDFGQGAMAGGAPAAMDWAGGKLDNLFAPSGSNNMGGQFGHPAGGLLDQFQERNQNQSRIPDFANPPSLNIGNSPTPMSTPGTNFNPDFSSFMNSPEGGGGGGSGSREQASSLMDNPIISSIGGFINSAGGAKNLIDMGGNLFGIYDSIRRRNEARKMANSLSSMFGPNSAYSKQLQQSLSRRDAAAGRRSQYGPRNVELQARLAELNSRNAPAIMQANQAASGGLNDIFRNVLSLGMKANKTFNRPTITGEQMRNWGRGGDSFYGE